jgi:hypothetical protein
MIRSRSRAAGPVASRPAGALLAGTLVLLSALPLHAQVSFTDVSDELDFTRSSVLQEGDGLAGAAWLDYDRDGWLDLYLTNGRTNPDGLYRNNGDGTFTNVSVAAGVASGEGATGVIAGDIDNDGDADLFLSGDGGMMGLFGSSDARLYRNEGNGTFTDITEQAGVNEALTPLSASFADVDNDGYLDLFVSVCGSLRNGQQHPNVLYRNNGDGTFTDIAASAGVNTALGACISYFSDYNDDGWIDLFVGNCNDIQLDTGPIQLFRNNGNGTFTDVHAAAGLGRGLWMGFAPGDADNDGDIDLFVTNTGASYPNADSSSMAYYRNNADGTFTDLRFAYGLDTLPWGWGATFQDFDNDGWLDLYYAGSMPLPPFNVGCLDDGRPGNPGTFLFNNGDGTFRNETGNANAEDLSCYYTSGVAAADYDQDGFVDLLTAMEPTADYPGRPFLWHNAGNGNGSVCIKLADETGIGNRDGVGAKVTLEAAGLSLTRERYAGSGFISMHSPWLHFGTGTASSVDNVTVRWSDGATDSYGSLPTGTCHQLNRGGTVGWTPESPAPALAPRAYPLPARDRLTLRWPAGAPDQGPAHWTLTDAQGRWTREGFLPTTGTVTLDLGTLPPALYILHIIPQSGTPIALRVPVGAP